MAFVIINPEYGGFETGKIKDNLIEKNFNLNISKLIYNKLKELKIDTYLLRDNDTTIDFNERINLINKIKKNDEENILITNALQSGNSSGVEIIYSLKDDDSLAREITNELENNDFKVLKYYQLRDLNNTNLDYYPIIRDINNIESIIIYYGHIDNSNDYNYLINDENKLANSVAIGIYNYIKQENTYKVLKNDTLYSIANKFNTTISKLKEINNLVSNVLIPGQTLIIPTSNNNIISLDEYINYKVKSGDSLYKIANNFNTTVNAIKDLNNLTSNNLSINQVLKIPTIKEEEIKDYLTYTVKSGDSLYKIASLYKTSIDDIKSLNNLTNNNLSINQVLKIPTTSNIIEEDYINYKVKSGDSLYKIASLYNTSINNIKSLNNLTSNNLSINQVLKIPTIKKEETIDYISYKVKSGDSLYKIASLYNTSINNIKSLNNLTNNNLSINQVLKIPKK